MERITWKFNFCPHIKSFYGNNTEEGDLNVFPWLQYYLFIPLQLIGGKETPCVNAHKS